jgi:glycosyltransferase involved in cell wall biosynthesis
VPPTLSVIVPAYNEAKTLPALLDLVLASPVVSEVVVVDDGSTDGTGGIVARYAGGPRVKAVSHERNRGKGAAIRTGIGLVTGEVVIVQDADLEYDPGDYGAILREFEDPAVSVVYGSRRLSRTNPIAGLRFYLGGVSLTWLTNLLYGTRITDEPTCYKAFRSALLRSLPLTCEGFEFCPEVTALVARRGLAIREVPISYAPRTAAEGKKIRARHWFEAVATLVGLRFAPRRRTGC